MMASPPVELKCLPDVLIEEVSRFLDLNDAAKLDITNKTFHDLLGKETESRVINHKSEIVTLVKTLPCAALQSHAATHLLKNIVHNVPLKLSLHAFETIEYDEDGGYELVKASVKCDSAERISDALRSSDFEITDLDLHDNHIRDDGAMALASALSANKRLAKIDLSCNTIEVDAGGGIAEALRNNETLTELSLQQNFIGGRSSISVYNQFDEDSAPDVFEVGDIAICNGVEVVIQDLDDAGIFHLVRKCNSGVREISKALNSNRSLMSLDISDNFIEEEDALAFVRVEKKRNKMTSLGLGKCGIGPRGASEISLALSSHLPSLTKLNLSGNHLIGDEGAASLATALLANKTLQCLQLCNASISYLGAEAIGSALQRNSSLKTLWLGNNNIGTGPNVWRREDQRSLSVFTTRKELGRVRIGKVGCQPYGTGMLYSLGYRPGHASDEASDSDSRRGVSAIAKALEVNTTLTELGLDCNQINDADSELLASSLSKNKTLKTLHLGFNVFTEAGVVRVVRAAKQANSLNALDLASSNFGDMAAIELASFLRLKTPSLVEVDLGVNGISNEGAYELATALALNSTLEKLNVSYNRFGHRGELVLKEAVAIRDKEMMVIGFHEDDPPRRA